MPTSDAVHTWTSLEEQVDALVHVTLPLLDEKQEYVVITTSALEGNDWSSSVRLLAFDPSTGHIDHLHAFRLPTTAGAVTWHTESSLLVVGGDDGDFYFLTFDCTSMKWNRVLPPNSNAIGHDDLITSIDASSSTFASASWDLTVKLWDVDGLSLVQSLQGHSDKVWAVKWQPQSSQVLASASQDRTVHLWDVRSAQSEHPAVLATPYAALCLAWQPQNDHEITAGLEDGSIYTFDIRSPNTPSSILANQHAGCVQGIVYNDGDKSLASYGDDAIVRLYSATADAKLAQLPRYTYNMHTDYVRGFAWLNASSWVVSSSFDKSVHFWQP